MLVERLLPELGKVDDQSAKIEDRLFSDRGPGQSLESAVQDGAPTIKLHPCMSPMEIAVERVMSRNNWSTALDDQPK